MSAIAQSVSSVIVMCIMSSVIVSVVSTVEIRRVLIRWGNITRFLASMLDMLASILVFAPFAF